LICDFRNIKDIPSHQQQVLQKLESLSGTVAEEKISTINNKDLNAFESSIT
jgi:hypothetical protein